MSDLIFDQSDPMGKSFSVNQHGNIIHQICDRSIKIFQREVKFIIDQFEDEKILGVNLQCLIREDISFNARCMTVNDIDLVGINAGTIVVIHEIMGRIICEDSFFCLGDELEIGERDKFLFKDNLYRDGIDLYDDFPFEDNYKKILTTLIDRGIQFLLHHELAHIWNGHLGLKAKFESKGSTIIKELGQNASFMLELDADRRAVHWLKTVSTTPILFPDRTVFYHSQKKFEIFLTVSSIYICLRCNQFLNGSAERDNNSSHPHPEDRILWAMETIFIDLVYRSNFSNEDAGFIVKEAVYRSERCFSKVFSCEEFNIFSENTLSRNTNNGILIRSKWKELKSMLEPHKRGMTLPDQVIIGGGIPTNALKYLINLRRIQNPIDFISIGRQSWARNITKGISSVFYDNPIILPSTDLDKFLEKSEEIFGKLCCLRIDLDKSSNDDNFMGVWKDIISSSSEMFDLIILFFNNNGTTSEASKLISCSFADEIIRHMFSSHERYEMFTYSDILPEGSELIPPSIRYCLTSYRSLDVGTPSNFNKTHPNLLENCSSISAMSYLSEVFLRAAIAQIHMAVDRGRCS